MGPIPFKCTASAYSSTSFPFAPFLNLHRNPLVVVMLLHARGHYLLTYQHLYGLCPIMRNSAPESCVEGLLSRATFGNSCVGLGSS